VIIVVASIKGAPGVTTTALAVATTWPPERKVWPSDRSVLFVEADPFGGDLAVRFGIAPEVGLWTLLAAGRRGIQPEAVWEHTSMLPGGLPILFGLTIANQAVSNDDAWLPVVAAFEALEVDLVVDVGRLLPRLGGGIAHLIKAADTLLVVCPPTLEGVSHLKETLPTLVSAMGGRLPVMVPTSEAGFSPSEITETLGVKVFPVVPNDRSAAATLCGAPNRKPFLKSELAKWSASVAATMAASASEKSVLSSFGLPMEIEPAEDDLTPAQTEQSVAIQQPDQSPREQPAPEANPLKIQPPTQTEQPLIFTPPPQPAELVSGRLEPPAEDALAQSHPEPDFEQFEWEPASRATTTDRSSK
jgi:MinD-like ATPase involved in chromosome partitioning or flagellar assembly